MYEAHFGLAELPFPTGQDPRYYVDTAPHRAAVLALLAGFERGDGFMLLTGEFGVGKTTIARRMLAQVDRERHRVVELTSLRIEGGELFDRIAEALGAPSVDTGHGLRTLSPLLEGLAAGGHDALVLIDEAQRLDVDSLDRLRELTAARVEKRGVLHLCLIGRAAPPGIEALRRMGRPLDLGATVNIAPLDAAGTREYLLAHLNRVGWIGRPSFDEGAFAEIHARCDGIPGRINRLCRYMLLQLYMMGCDDVDAGVVRAVDDLLQSELGGQPATLELPPMALTMPAPETRALSTVQDLPEWRRTGGVPATLPGFGAPGSKRWQRRWTQGAALAVVLSSGGIGWYAMSGHGLSRAEEARIVASWAMATSSTAPRAMPAAAAPVPPPALSALAAASLPAVATAPVALESVAPQTIAQSPPGAGPAGIAREPATTGAPETMAAPDSARTALTVATLAPQRLSSGAAEERLRTRRVRAENLRPAGPMTTTAAPAACSLEGETLGLCRTSRVPGPMRAAAREPAGDSSPRALPAGPSRPPCESTRAALGLCPER
jgi:type II secretory pathway predicted ATPase ExeA